MILHPPTHRFHENAGERGSLTASQARAPFIAAGAGVVALGIVDEHLRTVDAAPTLANHMTQSTGVFPGRSGVLHNAWHDRQRGHDVDLLDLAQMITARDRLRTDIETLHEAVHRADPHARTAAIARPSSWPNPNSDP